VASVRTIKNLGEIDPEHIVTPGIYVAKVVCRASEAER